MRFLAFLLCFGLALASWELAKTELKSEPKSVSVASTPAPKPAFFPFPKVEETKQITEEKNNLEYSGDTTINYNGYKIRNLENGLSISRKGKRLIFIPSAGMPFGSFGLKSLLGGNEKQLVYETWAGGNHGSVEHSIVDLSSSTPRVIFRSLDYDVQAVDDYDSLGIFDKEKDGILEITQKFSSGLGTNCAEASKPNIYVGFKYNPKAKKYLPMKKFTANVKEWIEQKKAKVKEESRLIREGKAPESGGSCGYSLIVSSIALHYIYIGKEKEGFNYLEKNYLVFDYEFDGNAVRLNIEKTKSELKDLKGKIKKYLLREKIYKAIYNR